MKYNIDEGEIQRTFQFLMSPGQVTELRALNAKVRGVWKPGTYSGYFNDASPLIDSLRQLESAHGVYIVLNPVNPALLARSMNKARIVGKEPTTSDKDIVRRRWLPIDVDPVRPAGIASSDEEHNAALSRITEIDNWMFEQGWPPGILADSGNGGHALYPIDLPPDDGVVVERCLKALAVRFDDELVKVDTSVHNPARIWKLYGTLACKGDDAVEVGRPHRMARLISVPDSLEVRT